jgi:hypothetical protein
VRADKKKTRKNIKNCLSDRARAMLHKIMGNLGKNSGNRKHNIIFFPLSPNIILMRGKKYHKKRHAPLKKEIKKEMTRKRKRKVAK